MGLNQEFDHVRSSILSVDVFPTVNKAFYLVQQVERQKQVIVSMSLSSENGVAVNANRQQNFRDKKGKEDKKDDRKCNFCHMKGHLKERCYKLHGYPADWRARNVDRRANSAEVDQENPLNADETVVNFALVNAVCKEMAKMFRTRDNGAANVAGFASFASTSNNEEFSGPFH